MTAACHLLPAVRTGHSLRESITIPWEPQSCSGSNRSRREGYMQSSLTTSSQPMSSYISDKVVKVGVHDLEALPG